MENGKVAGCITLESITFEIRYTPFRVSSIFLAVGCPVRGSFQWKLKPVCVKEVPRSQLSATWLDVFIVVGTHVQTKERAQTEETNLASRIQIPIPFV